MCKEPARGSQIPQGSQLGGQTDTSNKTDGTKKGKGTAQRRSEPATQLPREECSGLEKYHMQNNVVCLRPNRPSRRAKMER